MKKVLVIVIILLLLTSLVMFLKTNKTKYDIVDCNGVHHHTNKLLFDSEGCVKGWDDGKEFLVCGSYVVESLE